MVSRDSICLAFLIADLNDLDIMACDVGIAYLNAACREKVWFVVGSEFGSWQPIIVKIVRALYGLKSSGAACWRAMFNSTLLEMGFRSTVADPDVYLRANAKPCGFKFYEFLLVYVNDVLIVSHSPKIHLERIKASYERHSNSIGPHAHNLRANVERITRPGDNTGREYWSFSAHTYVRNAVKDVILLLQEEGCGLKSTAKTPCFLSTTYKPEIDMTTNAM
jgi:hypothetical protein